MLMRGVRVTAGETEQRARGLGLASRRGRQADPNGDLGPDVRMVDPPLTRAAHEWGSAQPVARG